MTGLKVRSRGRYGVNAQRYIPAALLLVSAVVSLCEVVKAAESPSDTTSDAAATPTGQDVAGVSFYGDISVVGSQPQVRSGIVSVADKLRVELNKICGEASRELQLPIIIRLHGSEGDEQRPRSVVSKITSLQGQYQLILHVHLARGVDQSLLRYHLMELLLYERGLGGGQKLAPGEKAIVRPWLVLGMLEAIDIKGGRVDRRVYRLGADHLGIMPISKLFDTTETQWREMIGLEPAAFRAVSGAMVHSLLRQPRGKPAMSGYLAEFATFKGEQENLLRKHFPGMNQSGSSLEKWINLELLELSTARLTDVLSILETEDRLERVLTMRYRNMQGDFTLAAISDYKKVMELASESRIEAVAGARAEIERLSFRCFPTYRPLLNEYEAILRDIARGNAKDIDVRLARLSEVRVKMRSSASRVRDYLDWYYITRSTEVSGGFEKYRSLVEALEKEQQRPPVEDSLGQYLDEVQRVFGSQ